MDWANAAEFCVAVVAILVYAVVLQWRQEQKERRDLERERMTHETITAARD